MHIAREIFRRRKKFPVAFEQIVRKSLSLTYTANKTIEWRFESPSQEMANPQPALESEELYHDYNDANLEFIKKSPRVSHEHF